MPRCGGLATHRDPRLSPSPTISHAERLAQATSAQGAACGDQRPVPFHGQLPGKRRVTNRCLGIALQPGLSTQHPLPPNRCVVAEGRERQAFATKPACGRGPARCDRGPGMQCVHPEVAGSPHHPARMPAEGAEVDAVRVDRDHVRPPGDRRLQGSVAGSASRGRGEKDSDEKDKHGGRPMRDHPPCRPVRSATHSP